MQRLKREGHRPDAMVIQMGNNGPLYSEDMEALRKATSDGIHLTPAGAGAYARLVARTVGEGTRFGATRPPTTIPGR